MGGVRDGDGARLDRAVGDSEVVDSEVVSLLVLTNDDRDVDLDPGHATYGGPAEGARPRGGYAEKEGVWQGSTAVDSRELS